MMHIDNLEDTFRFADSYWWFVGRRKILRNLIKKFSAGNKPSLALDAGCGTGYFMQDLKEFAFPIGIDNSEHSLSYAKKKTKNIIRGDICNMPFKDEAFDLITTLGVLYNETVTDDDAAIKEFSRVLKNNGILIIDESAYNFLRSRYNASWGAIRRYTRSQLSAKLKSNGFEILKSSYWNMLMLPIAYLLIKTENLLKAKEPRYYKISEMNGVLNRVLKKYLYFEAFLLKHFNMPFGTMVFIVGRRI